MLKLNPEFVTGLRHCLSAQELHFYLQKAVELEHSTIPPYLTAMLSLKPRCNRQIAELIHSIVMEEMLHMTIAGNILIALGGHPQINTPGFIPRYPGPLPMAIADGLIVGIEAFSLELVQSTFMPIEEPEHPIPIQNRLKTEAEEFHTIGQFYQAIKDKLDELEPTLHFGHLNHQVLGYFPADVLFPITSVASAKRAIDVIMTQGEGTACEPYQGTAPGERPQQLAHYYKFEEILKGRQIVAKPDGSGYCFGGAEIPFDPAGVYPMPPTPKPEDFPENTQARTLIERFAYSYSSLLNILHRTFNGEPQQMDNAIGLMFDLKVMSASLMNPSILLGNNADGTLPPPIGLSYVYVNTQGGMSYD